MKKILSTLLVTLIVASASFAQNNQTLNLLLEEINADSLHQTVVDLQNFGSRFVLREGGNKQVAEYIKQRLENYGVTTEIDSFHLEGQHTWLGYYSAWFYNVKGVITCQNPIDDSLVLIGAHFDAISLDSNRQPLNLAPGAEDNASGVAVMLEIARVLHENPAEFRRTINFMGFDGEELGLLGSHHDAEMHAQAQTPIAVMLNNDMVAYVMDGDWRVKFNWYDNALDVLEKAVAICSQYTDLEPFVPTPSENTISTRSDSYAYASRGFKALFSSEPIFSAAYHTEQDVEDSCNYVYHAEITKYNLAMLAEYAKMKNTVSVAERASSLPCNIFPNPASDKAMLQFSLDEACDAQLNIINIAGQVVDALPLHNLNAGPNLVELNFGNLPAGIYLCRFQSDKCCWTTKIIVQ